MGRHRASRHDVGREFYVPIDRLVRMISLNVEHWKYVGYYFSELSTSHEEMTDSKYSMFSAISDFYANKKDATFNKVWQQTLTVPFLLVVLLGPLVNFKSPTFFTKFNALGMYMYLIKYVFWIINTQHK